MATTIRGSDNFDTADNATQTELDAKVVGKVLQVVQSTSAVVVSTSSTSFVDSGLTASITPSTTNSKILVMITLAGVMKHSTNSLSKHQVVRGSSTVISAWNNLSPYDNTANRHSDQMSINILDTPSTTSSTPYKVQFSIYPGTSGITYIGENSSMSTITLMEIGA